MSVTRNVFFNPILAPRWRRYRNGYQCRTSGKGNVVGVERWPYRAVADAMEVIGVHETIFPFRYLRFTVRTSRQLKCVFPSPFLIFTHSCVCQIQTLKTAIDVTIVLPSVHTLSQLPNPTFNSLGFSYAPPCCASPSAPVTPKEMMESWKAESIYSDPL